MKSYTIACVDELPAVARDIIASFPHSRIITFFGSMGAGKTTFIKALCGELHVSDTVNSPSFAIVNEYAIPSGGVAYHFDFYRQKEVGEAYDMGYEDYFYSGNYCFVEWPEKIEGLIPEDHLKITIEVLSDLKRKITVEEN